MPVTPALIYQAGSSHLYSTWSFDGFKGKFSWNNTLLVPLVATLISGAILFYQVVVDLWQKSRRNVLEADASKSATASNTNLHADGPINRAKSYAVVHGGSIILSFKVARLLGCTALFVLSLITIVGEAEGHRDVFKGVFNSGNLPEIAMATAYWYATFLSAVSFLPRNSTQTAVHHANFVLFTAFSVYMCRDIWPLATFTERPVDTSEGSILWVKIALLTFTGVLVPLFAPRKYVPVDPEVNPAEVPAPEQTASIFSLFTYIFLDPLIFEAYKVPHLSHTRLPPLCDYDRSIELSKNAFPLLDPFRGAKKRHLFFSLVQVFFWDYWR
ncbi:hypothetical protein NLJ89_g10492 [Agrocybe chaxingu]|uniref:Uncharacterized protein n=1 Tax=Agrocybe chaxingu TaxID=84603 RepID=A0A9W8JYL3_9AGAR|nr:hypothetical protein NLJ89_g10492 [Agrocybe chaxingu]